MGAKVSVSTSEISMSNKGLPELTYQRSATEFTKLKSFNASKNNIQFLPKQLASDLLTYPPIIDTLTEVDLSCNDLVKIPEEICLLMNLRKLRLDQNQIATLPVSFPGLYKLEKLFLNDNILTELPLDMANMINLRYLRLHGNRLSWIPNDIGRLRLEELTIHENPLNETVLNLTDLEEVMSFFRHQVVPLPYSKALKAAHKAVKIKDGLHELKEGRLHAFRVLLASEESKGFLAFLEKEFAHENLLFYREVDAFRSRFPSNFPIVSKEIREAGLVIYKKFIEERPEDHKYAINIPIKVRKRIDEAFGENNNVFVNQWVFADAYVAVAKLMFDDSFKRYIETPEGKKIWAAFESHAEAARRTKKSSKTSSDSPRRKAKSSDAADDD